MPHQAAKISELANLSLCECNPFINYFFFRARRPVEQVVDTIVEQDQKKKVEETKLEVEKTEEIETVQELENNENNKQNNGR